MSKKRYARLNVKLHWRQRERLKVLLKSGEEQRGVLRRGRILELLDKGLGTRAVSKVLGVSDQTVRNVGWRYVEQGLEAALYERERPGAQRALDDRQSNEIIAMVCSDPPEGYGRWSIRLIAEEAKKRKIADVGRETIRVLLESHDLKPWRKKNVVRGGAG